MVDIYIWCTYQWVVKCNIIKYVQFSVDQYNPSYEWWWKYFGDVFYVVDTDAKKVYFYILWWQYTSSDFTPAVKIWNTSLSKVTQHSWTWTYYDTWTKVWANGCWSLVAIKSDIPTKVSQLTNDSWYTTNTGTITGITMNGSSKWTSGVVDLWTVITDISWKQDTLTAWNNVSISSNTISSDSTSILTQSDYNNLPSSKTSDNKTYFICETIS